MHRRSIRSVPINSRKAGAASRVIRARVGTDFDIWNESITGSGTITASGTNNNTIAIVNDEGFRTYKLESYTVTAGQAYAFSVNVDALTGGTDNKCKLAISVAVDSGDTEAVINTTDVGSRMCIKFVPTSTGVCSFRLGFGVDGASVAGTGTFSNIFVQELDSFASNPDDYFDLGAAVTTDRIITDLVCNNTVDANNQIVTSAYTTQATHQYSSGIAVGDSLVNAEDDWPPLVEANLNNNTRIWIKGVGGDELPDILADLPANLLLTGEDSRKSSPKYVLMTGGGNDVKNAASDVTDQMESDYTAMAALIVAAGMKPILVEITPFGNAASWTSTKQTYLDEMNTWLNTFATTNNYPIAQIYSLMEDDITPDALEADYDSGDGIHLNAAGNQVVADAVSDLIWKLR